jgi:hypothetical protein
MKRNQMPPRKLKKRLKIRLKLKEEIRNQRKVRIRLVSYEKSTERVVYDTRIYLEKTNLKEEKC